MDITTMPTWWENREMQKAEYEKKLRNKAFNAMQQKRADDISIHSRDPQPTTAGYYQDMFAEQKELYRTIKFAKAPERFQEWGQTIGEEPLPEGWDA